MQLTSYSTFQAMNADALCSSVKYAYCLTNVLKMIRQYYSRWRWQVLLCL